LTILKSINPLDAFLWTFRRNEDDVVKLYDTLSSMMQVATNGNMLNFGYWNEKTSNPLDAQIALCHIVSKMAEMGSSSTVLDVGSGFSEPALRWKSEFPSVNIVCVNVNLNQLQFASGLLANSAHQDSGCGSINLVNATATRIPLSEKCADSVIALESAQHFRPLNEFISESKRILKKYGILVIAIPIVSDRLRFPEILNLGILSFTWSSEHYHSIQIEKMILNHGFRISQTRFIGKNVYEPLADYYVNNRDHIQTRILEKYPSYVEKILFKSMLKMKEASQKEIIDYLLVKCVLE
jgi:ubiquinone/menaquinone biosynthesis C-methylase UbiE